MWDWSGTKEGYKKKVLRKTTPSSPPAYPPRYPSNYNPNNPNNYGNTNYQSPYPGYGVPDYSGGLWHDNESYHNPQVPPQAPQPMPPQNYRTPPPPARRGYPQQAVNMPQQMMPQQQMPQPMSAPPPQSASYMNNMSSQVMPAGNPDDLSMWEWQLDNFNLPGMELQEAMLVIQSPNWKNDMKKAFKRARRDFLKFVGYHHKDECLQAGVDEEGLKLLKKGRSPENFNVHMKIPLDYLGTNDFSNLCLIKTYPFHSEIHKFLDLQIVKQAGLGKPRRLLIPVPRGKVYVPDTGDFAPGGKDKHDRSVYAGFLESTFDMIKIKSSMGRSADM